MIDSTSRARCVGLDDDDPAAAAVRAGVDRGQDADAGAVDAVDARQVDHHVDAPALDVLPRLFQESVARGRPISLPVSVQTTA